jgi:hypothetical protein
MLALRVILVVVMDTLPCMRRVNYRSLMQIMVQPKILVKSQEQDATVIIKAEIIL